MYIYAFFVGWKLSNTVSTHLLTLLIHDCIRRHGKPQIIISDQESQYTGIAWFSCIDEPEKTKAERSIMFT